MNSSEQQSSSSSRDQVTWGERRRIHREARHLMREASRILKRHAARVSDETEKEIRQAVTTLNELRRQKSFGQMRRRIERLDRLLEKHFARYRKSAIREYAESIGVAILIALILRAFVVEAFKIPSSSMIPTLRVGDHIFVSKFVYGLRVPWTNIKFFSKEPERGEVIVFVYPVDPSKDFIKRVVALGGDTVEVRNNIVFVNGEMIERQLVDYPCRYPDTHEGLDAWEYQPCLLYEENAGPTSYNIVQDIDGIPSMYGPFTVPEGYVFVMGDNRNNSSDSRVWGPVPHELIKGKAMIIWWSRGVPQGVRWGRMFKSVHELGPAKEVIE